MVANEKPLNKKPSNEKPASEKQNSRDSQSLLFSALTQHAAAAPDSIALLTPERALSRRQLLQGVEQVASALAEQGLKRGEPCAIIAGNTIEHVLAMLGIARAGGVVAPLSLLLKGETLVRLIEDARPRFIFTDRAGRERLGDRRPTAVEEIMLDDQASFSRFLQTPSTLLPPMPSPDDRFSIIYSSGTTGVPKGIVHTYNARSFYGKVFAEEYGIDQDSVTLLTTALYSNASWMLLLPTLFSGATLVMPGAYRAESFSTDVEKYRVTHAFLVPTQINDLLALQSNHGGQVLPPVVISAGSHLLPALKRRILAQGARLFELYGNTEGAATLLRPGQMAQGLESVGSAISTGEIAILSDDEQLAETGCEGEIIGRSPLMSEGYFRRDDLNAELFWRDPQGRLFVRTGDIGEINQEGLLFLRGRKKDMLVSGGINVYPVDIETVLLSHPDISAAAVVGKAHPRWGETPHAFIVSIAAVQTGAEEFKAWANQQLDKHQRLDGVTLVAALPRNALGKVVKGDLQQWLAQEQADDH